MESTKNIFFKMSSDQPLKNYIRDIMMCYMHVYCQIHENNVVLKAEVKFLNLGIFEHPFIRFFLLN